MYKEVCPTLTKRYTFIHQSLLPILYQYYLLLYFTVQYVFLTINFFAHFPTILSVPIPPLNIHYAFRTRGYRTNVWAQLNSRINKISLQLKQTTIRMFQCGVTSRKNNRIRIIIWHQKITLHLISTVQNCVHGHNT